MKKIFILIVTFAMVLSISACSTNSQQTKGSGEQVQPEQQNKENGIETDKGLIDVTITVPKSLVGENPSSELTDEQKQKGFKSVTLNEDGSQTYVISKKDHEIFISELRQLTADTLKEIVTDGSFASIKDVDFNNNFSQVTLTVDESAFNNSFDSMAALSVYMSAAVFQAFNGDDGNVKIEFKNKDTSEVFKTVNYPEGMQS